MTAAPVIVELHRAAFAEHERLLARAGALRATAFKYATGVEAVRIDNGAGSVTLLPFQGQQIWDARFLGRTLTMRSMFDAPRPTRDYLRTYGAFFVHCGGTAMGNPGPGDTHPLHGELPNMPYDTAQLCFGEDQRGRFIQLSGAGRDTLAFDHDFVARPRVRIDELSSAIEVMMEVENLAKKPMGFLYLGHINFRPADGGVIVDTVRDDCADVNLRQPTLGADTSDTVRAYHRDVAVNISSHRTLNPAKPIEPELVLTMRPASGSDGWAHAVHRHPDGSGDFVSHRPAELPYAVRWLTRNGDQDALGLVLPATAAPDGLAAATANGQLITIEPGGRYTATMRFGALDEAATAAMESHIATIRGSAA